MSLPGPDDVGEAEGASNQFKHVTVSCDKTFTGEFAGAVGGDRNAGAITLAESDRGILAVNAAARRIEDLARAAYSHRLQDILGKVSALPEIDVRLSDSARDIGVGGEVKDRVAASHCSGHGF